MARQLTRAVFRCVLCGITFVCALALFDSVEAADGYYNGLKLLYPAGTARVVIRSTGHGPGRHAADFGMYYEDVLAITLAGSAPLGKTLRRAVGTWSLITATITARSICISTSGT